MIPYTIIPVALIEFISEFCELKKMLTRKIVSHSIHNNILTQKAPKMLHLMWTASYN
jgi:hypothetical protein